MNATITLLCPEGFEPLDDSQRVLNNTQTHGVFKLKAIAPGTYLLTLKLDGNAFFLGWPPPDEVSYVVNIVGTSSPMVEVSLEGGEPFFKHVNLTVRLENKGAGEALNTVLEFSGDVEPLGISVGSISAGETWTKMVTLRLKSEVANIRARTTFFDASGSKYVSEGFATVVSPSYVVPEHFEEYTLKVPEHFEKRKVFIPGYEGYTHVKVYHPYSAFEIPGSFTISFQGIILEAEGVKVYTSFLPIADEGFELRVVPKDLTLNIYGDVLVGPLIPVQGLQTTVPVKYVVVSVEPAFEEKLVREDEARMILNVTGCRELVAPEGYEVILASKRVIRKPVWVDTSTYRRLEQEGFGRIREGCYREEWPSADAICDSTPLERELYANSITLVYHPLQEPPLESSLVRGLWLRNYATQDIEYTVTVEPVTLPPGKPETTTLKVEKACCKELSILLFSNTTFWIRLHKGERLVAELFMPRLLSLPLPFSLQWWRGFAIGFIERSPRIMVNSMMLSTVAMVPRELMPVIAVALGFMKAYQVYNQRGEIFNATTALGNLTAMGIIYRGMAEGYRLQGKHGFAAICDELSQTFLDNAKEVASDLGLRLILDVSLDDLKTALGWRKAGELEQGYATGKIVGAMVEAVAYAATYATIYHELSTARDMLTAAGKAGQLSATTVLKRFGQGLYAWLTPAIWDLAETGMKAGAWLKGRLSLEDISKLIFADRVSKSLGETVGEACKTLPDGGVDIAKKVSDMVEKVTLDNDVPESVASKIFDILSRIFREYAVDAESGARVEKTAETIVEAWKRVRKLEAWGENGEQLIDWLESVGGGRLREIIDSGLLGKISDLEENVLEDVGKAWRLNPDAEDFYELLKNLDIALEAPKNTESFLRALAAVVESESSAKVQALEKYSKVTAEIWAGLKGDPNRAQKIGRVFDLAENVMLKMNDEQVGEFASVSESLLQVYGAKDVYKKIIEFREDLYKDVGLNTENVDTYLLGRCLSTWKIASKNKDWYVGFSSLKKTEKGEMRYQTNVRDYVGYLYLRESSVAPIIATPLGGKDNYIVSIPEQAVKYLGLKEYDFIIFLRDVPQGWKVIAPAKFDSEHKVTITEWVERYYLKDSAYTKYITQDGELDWDTLSSDYAILVTKVSRRDGSRSVTRVFAFRGQEQHVVRITIGNIAQPDEYVECEFLYFGSAYKFLESYGFPERAAQDIVSELYDVIWCKTEQDFNELLAGMEDIWNIDALEGKWGEWQVLLEFHNRGYGGEVERIRDKTYGTEIDIHTKRYLIQVKNWNVENWQNPRTWENEALLKLQNQMEGYKEIQDKYFPDKKAVLLFCKELPQDRLQDVRSLLLGIFGNSQKFEIVNGLENIGQLLRG